MGQSLSRSPRIGADARRNYQPPCIQVSPQLEPVAVRHCPLTDARLQIIVERQDVETRHGAIQDVPPFRTLKRAVELAIKVSQQPNHHGLMLALRDWDGGFTTRHVRLLSFQGDSGQALQRRFQGRTIFDNDVEEYLLRMTVHRTDHDGAVGASRRQGNLQLPRCQFEQLPPLRNPGVPRSWGCRRTTALKLALDRSLVVVVSEETGRVSLYSGTAVYEHSGEASEEEYEEAEAELAELLEKQERDRKLAKEQERSRQNRENTREWLDSLKLGYTSSLKW